MKTEQKKDTLLMPSAQIVKVPKLKQVLGASNPWVLGTRYKVNPKSMGICYNMTSQCCLPPSICTTCRKASVV